MPELGVTSVAPETPAQPAAKPEVPAAPKEQSFKVRIDGKEEVWPLSKLIERASKGTAAEKDMEEASKIRRSFNNFVARSQDPGEMFKMLGELKYDAPKQAALLQAMLDGGSPEVIEGVQRWLYQNKVQPAGMSEEQKKAWENEKKLQLFETQEKQRKTQEEQAKIQAETKRYFDFFRAQINAALKEAKLPYTYATIRRSVDAVRALRGRGSQVNYQTIAQYVRSQIMKEYDDYFSGVGDDAIMDAIPQSLAERINKAFLARLKKAEKPPTQAQSQAPRRKREKENKRNLAVMLRDVERGREVA